MVMQREKEEGVSNGGGMKEEVKEEEIEAETGCQDNRKEGEKRGKEG